MTTDEKIVVAEELGSELVGVERTEFAKWIEYVKVKRSLDKALELAKYLSNSLMLRERPQRGYRTIHSVMSKRMSEFGKLPIQDLLEILGYVERILVSKFAKPVGGTLKGLRITEREISKVRRGYGFRKPRK